MQPSNPTFHTASDAVQSLPPVSVVEAQGNVLNPDAFGAEATAHVPNPALPTANLVTLSLDGTDNDNNSVSHEESRPVDGGTTYPLAFKVPRGPIVQLTGNTATFGYRVEFSDGSAPTLSPPREYEVRVRQALPAPVVVEAEGEWLDPANVNPPGAYVQVYWSTMAVGDRVTLTWRGSTSGDYTVPFTIRFVGVQSAVIPKDRHVDPNKDGTVDVFYTVDGVGVSETLRLNVRGDALDLPAPMLFGEGVSGNAIDPGQVRVGVGTRLPASLVLEPGDTVRMSFGSEDVAGTPPEFLLLPNQIGRVLGQTVELTYRLTRNGVTYTSKPLSVRVGRIDPEDADLPLPDIHQATSDRLDLATFPGDATVGVPAWPMASAGQYVWLEVHGTANGAAQVIPLLDAHAVTAEEASSGLASVPLPRSGLETLDDGSTIEVKMWAAFDGSSYKPQAVLFPVRRYTIAQVTEAVPTITRVHGASGNVSNGGSTPDTTLTVIGTAEPGRTVEVFDGTVSKGRPAVDAAGTWRRQVPGLALGAHRFKARGLYGSQPESGEWAVNVVKPPLTISGFRDYWGTIYRNGSLATNNSPKWDGSGGPRDWLGCYPFGTGVAGADRVRMWGQSLNVDGSTFLAYSRLISQVNPDGSFQADRVVNSLISLFIPHNIVRHTCYLWLEDIYTGEQSSRLAFTFSPGPRSAAGANATSESEGEENAGRSVSTNPVLGS